MVRESKNISTMSGWWSVWLGNPRTFLQCMAGGVYGWGIQEHFYSLWLACMVGEIKNISSVWLVECMVGESKNISTVSGWWSVWLGNSRTILQCVAGVMYGWGIKHISTVSGWWHVWLGKPRTFLQCYCKAGE